MFGELIKNSLNNRALPTNADIFNRLKYLLKTEKRSMKISKDILAGEVMANWRKKKIRTCAKKHVVRKIENTFHKFKSVQRNYNRPSASQKEKHCHFEDFMKKTFEIADRHDMEKFNEYIRQQHKESLLSNSDFESVSSDSDKESDILSYEFNDDYQEDNIEDVSESDDNFEIDISTNKTALNEQCINIMTTQLACALDRANVSNRAASYILAAVVAALGFDVNKYAISHESIRNARRKTREKLAADIKANFKSDSMLTVHIDTKLLPSLLPSTAEKKVDRLSVSVSGNGVEKLLAVPKISRSSGKEQAEVVYETLLDWKLSNQ